MFSLKGLFGDPAQKMLKDTAPLVAAINALEDKYRAMDDEALRRLTHDFRNMLAAGDSEDELLPEVFAAVREAARRTCGLRHFDVQLVGGMVLWRSGIAEMKTGEGKTLVATLPASLGALRAKGVHVVTVNDYLARRDAVWMGQVYHALGMSVGVIGADSSFLYDPSFAKASEGSALDHERDEIASYHVVHEFLRPCTRAEAYEADITYGTNAEFGFDYLRDNISYERRDLRQRGHHFAIVDEIDSILIDEARTPLIISAPTTESEDLYRTFSRIAQSLAPEEDYTVDEKRRAIQLTDAGITKSEKMLGIENIYTEGGIKYVHHLETAVRARALFRRDQEYVVQGGEVIIVDPNTGRLQPGRRWSEGLHQAIEAKEGVPLQKESRTYASITYQNYFRLYERLAGMTGTAKTSAEEFYKVYKLDVVEVPTNKPLARKDHQDLIFQTEQGKFSALARQVKALHEKGQPVLIGTVSIERNELLSAFLKREGIPHEVLNAKNHEREGEIIAGAGARGQVTVATNMAGRGVDIKLGGASASPEEHEAVKGLGGLYVIGTERHEARRIDNQLRGRSGRQGDPGETRFFVSLEDNLLRIFAPDSLKTMMGRFGIAEDEPIENSMVSRALETAQTKIEGFNFDARKQVLEYDNVLDKQRRAVYERRRRIVVGRPHAIAELLEELAGPRTHDVRAGAGDLPEAGIEPAAGSEDYRALIGRKTEELGEERFLEGARRVMLQTLDLLWVEHLESMEYLRGSVSLRAYGQRDPLTEYRKEGVRMYKEMEEAYRMQLFDTLAKMTDAPAPSAALAAMVPPPPGQPEVGRNDPCPCGSGKKYKNCGLKNTEEHQQLMAKNL